MKIKFKETYSSTVGTFLKGKSYEVENALAKSLVKSGFAGVVRERAVKQPPTETR